MPKSTILLMLITKSRYIQILDLFICGSQQSIQLSTSFLLLCCLRVPCYSRHNFNNLGLLRDFRLLIWPQMLFAGQNYTNYDFSIIFAKTMTWKYRVENFQVMTMFISWRMTHSRGFNRWVYDRENVGGICEWARHSGNWARSRTLPLVGANLDSKTLVVVRRSVGFQVYSN